MRHVLLALIALLSGSALDALPTPIQILGPVNLGPVKQVPPQCADPTYACQDLKNARQCGVVKSCAHDIWATMSVPEDNEDICSLCKEMVKEARDQLKSNMTQEELKEVFEGSCELLPVKLIADACIKLVDEFIPDLVEMLASRMDPNMVCSVCGLCNMARLPIEEHFLNMLKFAAVNSGADKCSECTTIISEVKVLSSQMSEADFEQMVVKLCEEEIFPSICTTVVKSYAAEIYQFILSCNSSTVCTEAGVCPSVNKVIKVPLEHKKVGDDLVCQFCTNVLEHIKEMMTTNTTMDEFKTALLNFCTHLGTFSNKCTDIVNDYYDMIFDEIKKMNTKGVCTFFGLCQSGLHSNNISPLVKLSPAETLRKHPKTFRLTPSVPVKTNSQPWVKLVPPKTMSKKEFRKEADIETNDIIESAAKSQLPMTRLDVPTITIDRNLDCPFCKAVSFFLQKDLRSDRNRDSVKVALSLVCDKWVVEFPEECKSFLQKYSDAVEYHIVESNDFDSLCTHVKACPLEKEDTGVSVKVIAPTPAPGGEICDLCKQIFNEAETLVKNPKIQASVKKFLEQSCGICPEKQKCIDAIDQNVDKILAVIEKNLQGSVACPALHLCPAGSQVDLSPAVGNIECDLCKDLVQQLANTLQDPQAKQAVKSALERGCGLLPQELSTECKSFVDEKVDSIIQFISTFLDPDLVCTSLNVCPDSRMSVKPSSNDLECDVCKEIVQEVEDQIKDQKTEKSIKEALEKVCGYLPSSMEAKCKSIIDSYTDMLITLLLEEMNPAQICATLKICPEPPKIVLPPEANDLECDLCKEVVQKVMDEIRDQKTEEAIKDALEKVCGYFPESMRAKCRQLVDTYTDTLITLLMNEMTPAGICATLKLCPAQDLECESCQYLFHYLQEQLYSNDTQDELTNLLKRFCTLLRPQSFANNCEAFVFEYGSSLCVLLAEEMDPSVMCPKLGMCPSTKRPVATVVQKTNVQAFNECTICTTIVDYIDKLLEDDNVDKEVTQVVEKVCNIVPATVKDKCAAIIETYGPYILQMIGQVADSKQVCQDIDFCSRPSGHVHLLGGKKCTFGPSYWCQSKAHAASCKAEMYCTQKVWKD